MGSNLSITVNAFSQVVDESYIDLLIMLALILAVFSIIFRSGPSLILQYLGPIHPNNKSHYYTSLVFTSSVSKGIPSGMEASVIYEPRFDVLQSPHHRALTSFYY